MKVLIACEESQTVCKAFRARGHEAYSCDIQEPSGGKPEWHILGDALEAIKGGTIVTMDGQTHDVGMDSFGVEIFGRMKTSDKPGATRAGRRKHGRNQIEALPVLRG